MNFSTAEKVLSTIQTCDTVEFIRGNNRSKINNLFNGAPTISDADAKRMGIKININLNEAAVIAQHGRRQYGNAFLSRANYFKVSLPDAPPDKATDWGTFITKKINRILKKSRAYFELMRSQWAAVLLHGVAPKIWLSEFDWMPKFVALEDFRTPTDTECSLDNLEWFAVRRNYTEGELTRKVFGKHSATGWDKKTIAQVLHDYHDDNTQRINYTWLTRPEKMAEIVKQNAGYYSSDAVPIIPLWHFYYKNTDNPNTNSWDLCVVPDRHESSKFTSTDFLYESEEPVAYDINQLLHVQFGDLNNKAPFLIHSVRSLGYLMMEPVFNSNLLQIRLIQHAHENMNVWMRVSDPSGKARAQKIELYDKAIVPEGVTIVPQAERHQINPQVFEMAFDRTQELKQQASLSYTQDTEAKKSEDETATAVMARVGAVNAMMSGLLQTAFNYETFAYQEICRRFCLKNSTNDDVRMFIKDCRDYGIPVNFIDADLWEVEPDIPMGSGNPTMEMALVQQLLSMRPMFDATAQQEILHEATTVITGDPKKAQRWVPIGQNRGVTDAETYAEMAFSTLMLGVPVRQKEGLSVQDQIETLLGLMAGVVGSIETKRGNMATMGEVIGLQTVGQFIGSLIQQMAQDPAEKSRTKDYADALGKLMNSVKAFQQRLALQQQQNGENGNGEAAAKIALLQQQAQVKAQTTQATTAQKMQHKQVAFEEEQKRKDAQAFSEIQRQDLKAHSEILQDDTKTAAEVHRQHIAEKNKPKPKASKPDQKQ